MFAPLPIIFHNAKGAFELRNSPRLGSWSDSGEVDTTNCYSFCAVAKNLHPISRCYHWERVRRAEECCQIWDAAFPFVGGQS
jgi:hypothetical protein